MRKVKLSRVALLLLGASFFACQTEKSTDMNELPETTNVSAEIVAKLADYNINTSDVKEVDFMLPDGTTTPMIQVEGDIHMTKKQIMALPSPDDNLNAKKQYSTNNLVSQGKTITIIGYTGGSQGLSSREQEALQWAVNNYNRLNLSISFDLDYGTNYQAYDMVVYRGNGNGSGGSAGFPSGGDPYQFVQIYGLGNYNTNVIEHVITHEIGHSVGFRHTDWFSRQSCGQNTNEGTAGVGANHIAGTPTGYDSTSIMLACFSSNEDGEFNNNDITALQRLY